MHSYKHGSKYNLERRNLVCRNFSCLREERNRERERERERERDACLTMSKINFGHVEENVMLRIIFVIGREPRFYLNIFFCHFVSWNLASYYSCWNWTEFLTWCFCLFLILWNQAWQWFGVWHVFNCFCMPCDGYLT